MQPNNKAKKIIDSIKYITIATVDESSMPWSTPVASFRFDNEYVFYWASWKENQHSKNIRNNSNIFISIFDSTPEADLANGAYIRAYAEELSDKDEIFKAALVFKNDEYNSSDGSKYVDDMPRRIYRATPVNIWINSDSEENGQFIDIRVSGESD